MSVFTPAEITYLQSQRLARVATSGPGGQPHVVPVSFRYNPDEDTIDVGGHGFAQRKKYRDVQRNPRIAIVIDDLATVDPWRPRMIEIPRREWMCGCTRTKMMTRLGMEIFRLTSGLFLRNFSSAPNGGETDRAGFI